MIIAVLSLLIGLVALVVSYIFYLRASKELKKEANELRRLNRIMLQGLENAGWLELLRDSEGDLKTKKIPKNSEWPYLRGSQFVKNEENSENRVVRTHRFHVC